MFPNLETPRLLLRKLTLEDAPFIFKHFSDPQVCQYLMDEPPLTEMAQAEQIIRFYMQPEDKDHNRWGVVRKSDSQLIGTCGFHKWEKQYFRTEIGYDLSSDFWGYGYMKEAVRAAIQYGFECMALNRIDALVYVGHERSAHLVKSLGFQTEGILRDYFCLNGIFYDHYLLSLLHREWI